MTPFFFTQVLILLSYTGYKLRKQIANNLKRRSQAVKTAVTEYNTAAGLFNQSIKKLDIKEVLDFVYIGQFDLLRSSRRNLTSKPWTRPAEREALTSYYKLQRAQEEIKRLNVEIRRLLTYIHDHRLQVEQILADMKISDPHLAHQLERNFKARRALDRVHLSRFKKLVKSGGFTGSCVLGLRIRSADGVGQSLSNESANNTNNLVEDGGVMARESDELEHALQLESSDDDTDEETATYASEGLDIIVRQN